MITLDTLKLGKTATIEELLCTGEIKRRLLDLGFIKNTQIKSVLKSPSGDPTAFEVRNTIIAIRKEDCKNILISE